MCCVLRCMLEAAHCVLLRMLDALEMLEVMRCVLLCMPKVVRCWKWWRARR